jgi:hypothetical protein
MKLDNRQSGQALPRQREEKNHVRSLETEKKRARTAL